MLCPTLSLLLHLLLLSGLARCQLDRDANEVTIPMSYREASKYSPDPLHMQDRPTDNGGAVSPDEDGRFTDQQRFPIKYPMVNVCSNEYKITNKTKHIDNISQCLPGFEPRLASPRVVMIRRPKEVAATPLNLLLFSLDPNYLVRYNVYRVSTYCNRPKYELMMPDGLDTTQSYQFEADQQYMIEIGTDKGIPSGNWKTRGNYVLLFTADTKTLESRFPSKVWKGKDGKYPHYPDEYANYTAIMESEGKALLTAMGKEVVLGHYKPGLCAPVFDPNAKSFKFYWLNGAKRGCPGEFARLFTIELLPPKPGESGEDDQEHGETRFPRECWYNLRFRNGRLSDIAEKLCAKCRVKPVQEC